MNYQISSYQNNLHSVITHEQLEQVIKAISDGRYSWACVLILRFVGYNPLHFIPQRTYSRLIKEQSQLTAESLESAPTINSSVNSSDHQAEIQDFKSANHLEISETQQGNISGIDVKFYLKTKMAMLSPSKLKEMQN